MGSLKKFAQWLSNGGAKKEPEASPLIKMKIFNKRLARQIQKMEVQERTARKKAIDARKNGDIPGSKLHMKSSLQYRKWAHSTENFRVKMEGIQFKLEQAKAMEQFSKVATDIASTLHGLQDTVKAPEIAKMLTELDLGFGNMESVMNETTAQLEISEGASSSAVSEEEVEQALAEVDTEMSLDHSTVLPSTPISVGDANAEIDDLEEEIKKLKAQKNTSNP